MAMTSRPDEKPIENPEDLMIQSVRRWLRGFHLRRAKLSPSERRTLRATWVGIGLGAVTGLVFVGQFWQMRKQTEILNGQLKDIRASSINSERAWVGLDVPVTVDAIEVRPTRMRIKGHYSIKNFGHGPALKVVQTGDFVTPGTSMEFQAREADFYCDSSVRFATGTLPTVGIKQPGPFGHTLFPGQGHDETIDFQGPPETATHLRFVGCVAYLDQFETVHWTRFCMERRAGDPTPLDRLTHLDFCAMYNDTDKPDEKQALLGASANASIFLAQGGTTAAKGQIALTVLGAFFGALLSILARMAIEKQRKPKFEFTIESTPLDRSNAQISVNQSRFLRVSLLNRPMPRFFSWFLARSAAYHCTGDIQFHYLDDGAPVVSRAMPVRWAGSDEPLSEHVLEGGEVRYLFDFAKYNAAFRRDCFPGTAELVDVAGRYDDEEDCYGWSNESYLTAKGVRNPDFKLAKDRYLVKVTIYSSGEKASAVFKLENSSSRENFRLSSASEEEESRLQPLD
jgi:hypothetical protein